MNKKTKNQNDSLCSRKECEKQKKLYKKIFGFVSSRFLFFTIGLFISVAVLTAYAAWDTTVITGETLTATKWNDLVDRVKEEDSNWKILAQGSDWTEEAIITLQSTGTSFDTDHALAYDTQRVNIGTFNWPQSGIVNEIIFKVINPQDDFCAGGGFTLDLAAGGEIAPSCQDFRYHGTTLTRILVPQDDGIKIAINGVDMDYCPDQYGRKSDNVNFKGTYGHNLFGVLCYYKAGAGADYASSTITKIEIKEMDHSPFYSNWNWEIWYR